MAIPAWAGETVVILASGPSLTAEDVALCKGRARTIAVNDCYRLAPWAEVVYAADPEWWEHHLGLMWYTGERWTQDAGAARKWGLNWIQSRPLPGLSLVPDCIHQGRNSGYQALNLAVLWGASHVVLLGFDMQRTGGRDHWFGRHPKGLRDPTGIANWAEQFPSTLAALGEAGVTVTNCSRETAINCFPRQPLAETI